MGPQSFDFDQFDQRPPSPRLLYFLLTCCPYTLPEEAAGAAEIGDELPCPHCGDVAAVYCIQDWEVVAPECEEEEEDEITPYYELPYLYYK